MLSSPFRFSSASRYLAALLCVQLTGVSAAWADDEAEQERVVAEQRRELAELDPVLRPLAPWAQIEVGGSFYDARRDVFSPRLTAALLGGWRFERFGLLGMVEFDRSWDFTRDTATLTLLNAGVGGEALWMLGHMRTSVVGGVSVLLEETAIDDAGTAGWFLDVRPASVRWPMGEQAAFELTPLSLDLTVPVTEGLPLILVAFMTRVGVEWSF